MNVMVPNQLSSIVTDYSLKNILKLVENLFLLNYKNASFQKIVQAAELVERLFTGKMKGYRSCNTEYHDLPHTLDVFLATARLLDGYSIGKELFNRDISELLLIASLLHDSGYIQLINDFEGTGAKYTVTHVDRSIDFVMKFRNYLSLSKDEAEIIGRLIKASDFSMNFSDIPYANDSERIAGAILGSADLMGQMADRIYLEKLLFLYYEFREAGIPGYSTEFDILKKTVAFYEITQKRLSESFFNIGQYARIYFKVRHGVDDNLYQVAIDRNMEYLNRILNDTSSNFRTKLKRKKTPDYN